jgi:hypothetical protein
VEAEAVVLEMVEMAVPAVVEQQQEQAVVEILRLNLHHRETMVAMV